MLAIRYPDFFRATLELTHVLWENNGARTVPQPHLESCHCGSSHSKGLIPFQASIRGAREEQKPTFLYSLKSQHLTVSAVQWSSLAKNTPQRCFTEKETQEVKAQVGIAPVILFPWQAHLALESVWASLRRLQPEVVKY